ncbi:DNA-processing protein DprA [Ferrovum sp.]|uniref:DNA-processing protein DprA n=1 Tax=Ferrovum sp. TaxID=2609467 RepID=UPI00260E7980|nr:DNA-processing protein DprA [Ferrovum sp.]
MVLLPDSPSDPLKFWLDQEHHHYLRPEDHGFPATLKEIHPAPVHLYLIGHLSLLQCPMLAIVGSRHASAQGILNATFFARALSQEGLTIISGLATGIDAAAHRGGLQGCGKTVAVMGTGIDRLYPPENRALAQKIAEQGLILSEFDFGTPARPWHFPHRNRLIAALSLGCLVVEASLDSGSLITAQLALEQGKEVFALPGSIHNPLSRGCHQLIREGAKLVENIADILDELPELCGKIRENPASPQENFPLDPPHSPFPSVECLRLWQNMGELPMTLDRLAKQSNLTMSEVALMLTSLELAGHVVWLSGGRVQRLVHPHPGFP